MPSILAISKRGCQCPFCANFHVYKVKLNTVSLCYAKICDNYITIQHIFYNCI